MFDDLVVFNFGNPKVSYRSNTERLPAEPYNMVFHELAESYAKTDGGMATCGEGHGEANRREEKPRDQRPNLKHHNTGGGPRTRPSQRDK